MLLFSIKAKVHVRDSFHHPIMRTTIVDEPVCVLDKVDVNYGHISPTLHTQACYILLTDPIHTRTLKNL